MATFIFSELTKKEREAVVASNLENGVVVNVDDGSILDITNKELLSTEKSYEVIIDTIKVGKNSKAKEIYKVSFKGAIRPTFYSVKESAFENNNRMQLNDTKNAIFTDIRILNIDYKLSNVNTNQLKELLSFFKGAKATVEMSMGLEGSISKLSIHRNPELKADIKEAFEEYKIDVDEF